MARCKQGGGSSRGSAVGAQNDYFSYTDANGVEVVVGRLADVPPAARAQAKHIDLSTPALRVPSAGAPEASTAAGKLCFGPAPGCIHPSSFLIGAATALLLGGVAMLLFRKAARLVAVVAGVIVLGALAAAYLTHVRRAAGLPDKGLVTPGVLLDDARAAVEAVDQRNRQQAKAIDEIEPRR